MYSIRKMLLNRFRQRNQPNVKKQAPMSLDYLHKCSHQNCKDTVEIKVKEFMDKNPMIVGLREEISDPLIRRILQKTASKKEVPLEELVWKWFYRELSAFNIHSKVL